MNRLVPTAVIGFAVLMLFFRGLELERASVDTQQVNTSAYQVADNVFQAVGNTAGIAIPPGMMIAGIALVLALGYAVMS